jgi:hypothetical protein
MKGLSPRMSKKSSQRLPTLDSVDSARAAASCARCQKGIHALSPMNPPSGPVVMADPVKSDHNAVAEPCEKPPSTTRALSPLNLATSSLTILCTIWTPRRSPCTCKSCLSLKSSRENVSNQADLSSLKMVQYNCPASGKTHRILGKRDGRFKCSEERKVNRSVANSTAELPRP